MARSEEWGQDEDTGKEAFQTMLAERVSRRAPVGVGEQSLEGGESSAGNAGVMEEQLTGRLSRPLHGYFMNSW